MINHNRAINRVFTRKVITDLIEYGSNEVFDVVVKRHVDDPESKTHGQIISEIYTHLYKEHRNEYYYMNTLLNRLLVGYHSVNTTTALSQIRVGQHIVDFVMINGEFRAYEIKSNLDNFERLYDQISDYYKAFSKVTLLTSLQHEYEKIVEMLHGLGDLGDAVGICLINNDDDYINRNYRREPKQYDYYLDHTCIFKLLRKKEYENALIDYYGKLPEVAPVFYFRECLAWFSQIPIIKAQDLARIELKKRNKICKTVFDKIQPELKSTMYFAGLSRKLPQLEAFLQSNYRR